MKKILVGLLILVVLVGAAACGRSEKTAVYSGMTSTTTQLMVESARGNYGSAPGTTTPSVVWSADSGKGYYSEILSLPADRMVISSAYLTLVVDNVTSALTQITNLAATNGGFVINSNIQEDQNRLYANISFRVDSAKFNETLQALHNLAVDVKSESTAGDDVTEQYTDLNSQLRNLEASETQLLELMKQAGEVSDILEVQRELTNTRGQIEQIKGQMQYLEQSSSLALISASLEQSKLTVEFTANTRIEKEGNPVQFYSNVSGGFYPYSYEWDFGDGNTSTEPDSNPSHIYRSSGTYTVTLKITDDKGHTAEFNRNDYVTITAGWNAGSVSGGAWNALVGFGHFLASFFIGLGIFSPVWIAVLVILYFAWWRRRKKKTS